MVIALLTGGLSLPQAILALLPEAPSMAAASDRLSAFHEAMSVFLGACDGPPRSSPATATRRWRTSTATACGRCGSLTTKDYALAASELTGTVDLGHVEEQKLFGPGDTVVVSLKNGDVLLTDAVHRLVSTPALPGPRPGRVVLETRRPPSPPATTVGPAPAAARLRDDSARTRTCCSRPLDGTGKAGGGLDGRRHAAPRPMLDRLPRRLEDHFKLRFAQEADSAHRPHPRLVGLRDSGGARRSLRAVDERQDDRPRVRPARADPPATADADLLLAGREGVATPRPPLRGDPAGPPALETALDEVVLPRAQPGRPRRR